MGRYTFHLPDIGEGIAEAEIVAWHVRVGDEVAEDSALADMMTDKATIAMESPVAGRVIEVAGEVGDRIAIGAPLVVLETATADEAAPAPAAPPFAERIEAETSDVRDVERTRPKHPPQAPPAAPSPVRSATSGSRGPNPARAKVLASPAVRQRARELGIDLGAVRPAETGRIRHADLEAFRSYGAAQGYAPAGESRSDEQVQVVGLRRRIAENMAAAKRHIPHFSYVEECDVTELENARGQLNAARGNDDLRPRLTLLPFLITAICRAVPRFPMINARYDDEAGIVTRHGAVHLGIATRTDAGLMVPVVRNAQALNLWQLAGEIARLAEAARSGRAAASELAGSTLTVSSLGSLGGIASTPVINRPEVAIIAPNRIIERPMIVPDEASGGDRIARRKLMNLSISCDHRVVDGWDAASFVQAIKGLLEAPAVLLANP